MATDNKTIEFICAQLDGIEYVCRKMFGEFSIYHDGKIPALVCNNRLLVKATDAAVRLIPDAVYEPPYMGAKDMILVKDLSDADFLKKLIVEVAAELPTPKPKKKK